MSKINLLNCRTVSPLHFSQLPFHNIFKYITHFKQNRKISSTTRRCKTPKAHRVHVTIQQHTQGMKWETKEIKTDCTESA